MAIWAVSLLTSGASPPPSNCRTVAYGIRSLIEAVAFRPIRFFQCSTPIRNIRRKPESSFGENQLLQRSISFSLQPTSHPKILHNLRVRPSLSISGKFSLLMGSSRCFGSDTFDEPSSNFVSEIFVIRFVNFVEGRCHSRRGNDIGLGRRMALARIISPAPCARVRRTSSRTDFCSNRAQSAARFCAS